MEVKELRIGNLIDRTDYICKVIGIDILKNDEGTIITEPLDFKGERFVVQEQKPIPLTEEWLIKFGFRCRFDIGYNGWYSPNILGESIRIFEVENGWFKYSSAHTVIKNLHQLQNLYYALTNEELTIK